jgi:hypothetical protein
LKFAISFHFWVLFFLPNLQLKTILYNVAQFCGFKSLVKISNLFSKLSKIFKNKNKIQFFPYFWWTWPTLSNEFLPRIKSFFDSCCFRIIIDGCLLFTLDLFTNNEGSIVTCFNFQVNLPLWKLPINIFQLWCLFISQPNTFFTIFLTFQQKIQLEVLYNSTMSKFQKSIILHDFGGTFVKASSPSFEFGPCLVKWA